MFLPSTGSIPFGRISCRFPGRRSLDQPILLQGGAGLGIGAIVADESVTDTMSAYIYWQNPPRFDDEKRLLHIRSGQLMDVKLQADKPVRDSVTKSDNQEGDLFQLP